MAAVNVTEDICEERHRRIDEFLIREDLALDSLRSQMTQIMSMITDLRLALQAAQARNTQTSAAQQIEINDLPRTRKIPGPILYIGGGAGIGVLIEIARVIFNAIGTR